MRSGSLRPARRAGLAALLATCCLVIVACSSSAPTATPPAATASPSIAPSPAAPSPSAEPSDAVTPAPDVTPAPTFTRDSTLEALIPKKLGGKSVNPTSLSGTDIVNTGRPADIAALDTVLAAVGKTPKDYAFAYSIFDGPSLVGVFRVDGVPATQVQKALVDQTKALTSGASVESGTIGGKKVTIVRVPSTDAAAPSGYYWPKDDVLYYVQTADPTFAEEALASL
jgi:hypothetical protein